MSTGERATRFLLILAFAFLINPVRGRAIPSSDYVGAETCKTCHEDIFKSFETTPHFKTTLSKRGPEWQGCEACHGPGKEHTGGVSP